MKSLAEKIPSEVQRQTLMFSATFDVEVQELAKTFLKEDFVFVTVGILGAANEDIKEIRRAKIYSPFLI